MLDLSHALIGQEHVKRAIEVAAVQDHMLTLVVEDGAQEHAEKAKQFAHLLGVKNCILLHGDYAIATDNSVQTQIGKPSKRRPDFYHMPVEAYVTRISAAKKKIKKIPQTKELQPGTRAFLNAAIRQLDMTEHHVQHMLTVARSILALDYPKVVNLTGVHIAEAVQYRPRMIVYL
jgi:predicted ATPase with chaperone activity